MSFLSDPESDNVIIKILTTLVLGAGTLLMVMGKKMGGDALGDIKELKKNQSDSPTYDDLAKCQQEVLKAVTDGMELVRGDISNLRERIDNHMDNKGDRG